MPPERVLGAAADERSDLYSLGCVAYWMLTGRAVFTGRADDRDDPSCSDRSPAPIEDFRYVRIPDRLEQIVLSCLEKAPEKRPASAVELWHQLGEVTLTPPWTPERAEGWWREHLPDLARPSQAATPARGTERFQLEARTIARLTSPNTVRLYDFGVSETGSFYFVMELLTGVDVGITGAALRAAASGARRRRAAPGVPLSRRGACRGDPAPRHQTAESFLVPVGSRFRCREGTGLRPRQVARRRRCPAHDRRRSDRDTRLYATRACHGRDRRRAIRPVLARLRGLLDADRPRGIHGRADEA